MASKTKERKTSKDKSQSVFEQLELYKKKQGWSEQSNNQNTKDTKQKNNNNQENNKLARAPYNFISFPDEAYMRYTSEEELPKFDKFEQNLNTGYIDFEFENETELFVGNEKKENTNDVEFFTNINGQLCIPGSSIRGVIRKNCEILGFSFPEFVEDKTLLYRKFATMSGKLNKEYGNVIKLKPGQNISDIIKAGYIYKDKNEYKLIPAKEINKKSFFIIDERNMANFNLPRNTVSHMYKDTIKNFRPKSNNKNDRNLEWDKFLKSNTNRSYQPYSTDVTYMVSDENKIIDISTGNKLKYKGVLCNSNYMNKKKKHYIVNEIDKTKQSYTVADKLVIAYENDCETYKNQRKNDKYYELPKKDGVENGKVFFYKIENNQVAYFGRSPYLRIFYKYSIRDSIKTTFKSGQIDYANAMFGYTKNNTKGKETLVSKVNNNYKSRISFMDIICENPNIYEDKYHITLSSPKPTSPQLYLSQEDKNVKNLNTLNDSNAKLRGYKFYWNKSTDINEIRNNQESKLTTNMINTLKPKNNFRGRVYFENLYDDELGLLLLAINFDKECKESIGMGKPYGYGRIYVNNVQLYLEDIENKFIYFENNYKQAEDIDIFKNKYIKYISNNANIEYLQEKHIREYLKSKKDMKDSRDVSYMQLQIENPITHKRENEYNTLGILPEALEVK